MFENASLSTLGAGIIVVHEEKVLLVQINYGKAKGRWILPGGTVDKGETPEAAALRELYEETGLKADLQNLVAYRHRKENREKNDANIYFVFSGLLQDQYKDNPEQHFQWDPREIISVKFWPISEALNSEVVQPATRLFLKTHRESKSVFYPQSNPNLGKFEDSVFAGKIDI
jgi:8-oxo-dGTP pyrophosphatase MutT (NUDIX family)